MSTISTGGSRAPSTRAARRRRRSACTDSRRGVALPPTSTAPPLAAPRPAAPRAAAGVAAGVVGGVALVLVGGVVLLVDDDQPDVLDRREPGRARPDAHAGLTRPQPRPLVVALARRQARVQHGDGVAEARQEAP